MADESGVEEIRRSFARAWGEIGAAWGVAPSTATVQGYLLASRRPADRAGGASRAGHEPPGRQPGAGAVRGVGAHRARRSAAPHPASAARRRRPGRSSATTGSGSGALRGRARSARPTRSCRSSSAASRSRRGRRRRPRAGAACCERLAGPAGVRAALRPRRGAVRPRRAGAIERVFAVLELLDDAHGGRLWSLVDELEPDELVTRAGARSPSCRRARPIG